MAQHRSISNQLKRAKALDTKRKIAIDWAHRWHQEQAALIAQLGQAIKRNDFDAMCIITGELKAVTQKRFEGLLNVVNLLVEDKLIKSP